MPGKERLNELVAKFNAEREKGGDTTKVTDHQVKIWFANRRSAEKRRTAPPKDAAKVAPKGGGGVPSLPTPPIADPRAALPPVAASGKAAPSIFHMANAHETKQEEDDKWWVPHEEDLIDNYDILEGNLDESDYRDWAGSYNVSVAKVKAWVARHARAQNK